MEIVTKEFDKEIGTTLYTFDIEFGFTRGKYSRDPREATETTLDQWGFYGPIYAFDDQLEAEWIVNDEEEIQRLKDSLDIWSLFECTL